MSRAVAAIRWWAPWLFDTTVGASRRAFDAVIHDDDFLLALETAVELAGTYRTPNIRQMIQAQTDRKIWGPIRKKRVSLPP